MKHFNLNLCLFDQYINMVQVFLEFAWSISRTLVLLLLLDCLCISALNLLIYLDFMFFICFYFRSRRKKEFIFFIFTLISKKKIAC